MNSIQWCFNPCSYGSSVLTKLVTTLEKQLIRVSILVLMDLPFLLSAVLANTFLFTWTTLEKQLIRVSILVLMDLPFLHESGKIIKRQGLSVSILVLMDLPFLQFFTTIFQKDLSVSILVLMDLPFLQSMSTSL